MATSELEYFSKIPTTFADSQKPISAGQFRFAVNNGLHIADSCANPLVNWIMDSQHVSTSFYDSDPTVSGEYRRLFHFGPFNLSMRADGNHYPIRVRAAGGSDKATGATIIFVLSSAASSASYLLSGLSNTAILLTGSGTPAWSGGALLTMNSNQVRECQTTVPVIDEIGGVVNGATVTQAVFEIWATTTNSGATREIHAVYAAEYIGL